MADPLATIRHTPQTHRADARQEKNNAGGFSFTIDDLTRLRRFLMLGTDGGTYYVDATELTMDNADVVFTLAANRSAELVTEIVAVSQAGRAPK